MAFKINNYKFQKKYIAFFTIVPLLILTSVVKVDCPVCEGSGYLNSTPGMENVDLIDSESKELKTMRDACSMYLVYLYEIKLTLQNNNDFPVEGWIKLVLREFQKARVMDIQYLPIRIIGKISIDVTYYIGFTSALDMELLTEVDAEVLTGEFKDEACNGTGKVALNTWSIVNGLQSDLREISRTENQYKHPIYVEPDIEDEMIMDEFN